MPFTHYLCDRYVLLHYVPELSTSDQGEVGRHYDRIDDEDGVADAMKAITILTVEDVPDEILNRAEPHNLKNAVERAYQRP